mgnify:CR=1 FL=1
MHRDWKLFIQDIVEAIEIIREYTSNMDKSAFLRDRKTQDAVIRNLEIIGEASRSLPQEIKDNAPTIEWRKITALRNILIHEYFGVSRGILWDIIENKLSELHFVCKNKLSDQK